jgi:hypothetical protein
MRTTTRAFGRWLLPLVLCGAYPCVAIAAAAREPLESLDLGYRRMYSLDFEGAERAFSTWQRERPEDPRGPVSEAAGLLFRSSTASEFWKPSSSSTTTPSPTAANGNPTRT